jgi:hypothetical protein
MRVMIRMRIIWIAACGFTGQASEEHLLISCRTGATAGARAYGSPSRIGERG